MKRFAGLFVSGLVLSGTLLVGGTAGAAPANFIPAQGKAIENQYIVVLKEGANPRSIAAAAGVSPKHVYEAVLNGFAAELNHGQLIAIRNNPHVDYVEQDGVATIDATQTGATWGLDRIDQRALPLNSTYNYTSLASNVTAYIIDTGLNASHSDFGTRARNVYDAFGGTGNDCNGHGTHVGGTVGGTRWGVAKGVQLRGVRVLDCNGSGSWSGVIAGMDWVRLNAVRPAVANMSLGGGANASVDTAATNLANSGVFTAVAAGNSNANACNYSPARAAGVLTVGATASNDTRSTFSNYGTCVEIYAPGTSITSAWIGSTTATNTISGTSMASPHAAGVGALYKGNYGDASQSTINSWIINNGTSLSFGRLLYKAGL